MEMFSYTKRGYNPEEVDAYINTLEQVIKSYKDKDNAIKNAIISAQVAADNIMKNAQAQANDYKIILRRQLQGVKDSLEKQRAEVRQFNEAYNAMLKKYLKDVDGADIDSIDNKLKAMENSINSLGGEIEFETSNAHGETVPEEAPAFAAAEEEEI